MGSGFSRRIPPSAHSSRRLLTRHLKTCLLVTLFTNRILGSRFDQARTFVVCTAPTAEATRGHMETIYASFTCINISSEKMSQYMEIASNIQTKNFGLNVRRNGLQPTIFVRSFSQITNSCTRVSWGVAQVMAIRRRKGQLLTLLRGRERWYPVEGVTIERPRQCPTGACDLGEES